MSDLLFTNVEVFDGSGAERFPGQVLVRGDTISAVVTADAVIEAKDKMLDDIVHEAITHIKTT